MWRIRIGAAALLLAGGCSQAAPADVTAHYAREGQPALVAMASPSGDARVAAGDTVFVRKGGADYIVLHDSAGSFAAGVDDALAVFAEDETGARVRAAQPEYALSPAGPERVAGVSGTLWKGHPRETPSVAAFEAVVSSDPALAPLGRALALQARFAILRNSAVQGGPGNFERAMLALFAKGAVLRFNQVLRLERIDRTPIPADRFAVSQPVLGRDALRTRLLQPPKD